MLIYLDDFFSYQSVFVPLGDVPILSAVDKLDNINRASGKFGGVAGVFAGVKSYKEKEINLLRSSDEKVGL